MNAKTANATLIPGLAILLLISTAVALMFGGSHIGAQDVFSALLHPIESGTTGSIIWKLRFPRILLGLFTGMGLAASGCVFQGILRNPLADPYTLGISGGAALGATLGMITGLTAIHTVFLPLSAFAGAFLCMVLVYLISTRRSFSAHTMILSGVILGFICSSLVLLIFALTTAARVHAAILWLMGDLSAADPDLIRIVAVLVPAGIAVLFFSARELNVLTLGEDKAVQLGVDAARSKKLLFITASFIASACVCGAGIIGFVGLMIPHFMRRITGPDHRILIPASALGGAIFLPLCDTIARSIIAPLELPVGVITGFAGGIFFLLFLFRSEEHNVF